MKYNLVREYNAVESAYSYFIEYRDDKSPAMSPNHMWGELPGTRSYDEKHTREIFRRIELAGHHRKREIVEKL